MAKITVPIVLMRFTHSDDCTLAPAGYLAATFGEGAATAEQLICGLNNNKWAREPEIVVNRSDESNSALM